jgi:hypothetical protein
MKIGIRYNKKSMLPLVDSIMVDYHRAHLISEHLISQQLLNYMYAHRKLRFHGKSNMIYRKTVLNKKRGNDSMSHLYTKTNRHVHLPYISTLHSSTIASGLYPAALLPDSFRLL